MITITNSQTKLEENLQKIDAPLKHLENWTRNCIFSLNASFNAFWSLSDAEIEEIMNAKGIVELQEIFEAHFKYANGFNQLLEDRGISFPRAVTVKPREITVDENGVISLVPLPQVQPEIPVE